MTYFMDFAKNLIRKSNIGIGIFLVMNTLMIVAIFSYGFSRVSGIFVGIAAYAISLAVALSPIGEWILRFQTGSKKIKREEYVSRLEPLFLEVLAKAKEVNPSIPDDVQLFMNDDPEPNAFATGRKTVCLTKGFLNYSDEEIKATFAHELGHLGHKDTDLILVVTIGNFIVTSIFILFRVFVRICSIFSAISGRSIGDLITDILVDIILAGLMWIWTKIGTMLIMYSSRQNEFLADEFAFKCGYGDSLAAVLDSFQGSGTKGLWANLASSHPESDARIARLQSHGSTYIKA